MPMFLDTDSNHVTFENVERRKQRCRSVPFVIMRDGSRVSTPERQSGLCAV